MPCKIGQLLGIILKIGQNYSRRNSRGLRELVLFSKKREGSEKRGRDQSQHPRARNDYDEETAYESYMNPEPGFQSGPGDSVDAD